MFVPVETCSAPGGPVVESIIELPEDEHKEAHLAAIAARDKRNTDRERIKGWAKSPPTSAKEQAEAISTLAGFVRDLMEEGFL